jgi:hypothetical protein
MSKRTFAAFFFTLITAFCVYGQDATATQTAQPTPTPTPAATPNSMYVFPTKGERFKRYVNSTVGPFRLARTAVSAGLDQWKDNPEEWGQGMEGYGKRYASGLGRNALQQTITYGLDSALHLDTGFQRSNRDGFFPRLKHALLENVTSRTRSGKRVIAAPRFVGVYTGAVIASETWYPERYSYKDGLRNGTGTIVVGFGINLIREFVINW